MALPALQTFQQCADWSKTVEPYIPQLYELPTKLLDVAQSRLSLLDLYTQTNPFISGLAFSIFLGAVFLVVSELNQAYSQVDRCWSILPTLYIAHFDLWARLVGIPSERIDALLFFGVAWSIRLTYNYWRKGGYNIGSEDYRWEIIRRNIPRWAFHLLNLTFISFMQSVILFLLAAPVYPILLSIQFRPEIDTSDLAFATFEVSLVIFEWFADQQQWDYQTAKQNFLKNQDKVPNGFSVDDLNRGFITSALWAYSRHPNFAAEQIIWVTLYFWSAVTTETPLFWTAGGSISLVAIFFASTIITEEISAGKYPEYRHYQKQVGKFLPLSLSGYKKPNAPLAQIWNDAEELKKQR